jgi:4-hydroxy-tetrahydrodipicolinate synthase
VTTPFTADLEVDHDALREQVRRQVDAGVRGIVALGSLGEGSTLAFEEKIAVLESCLRGTAGRAPVVAGIAALSTREAVALARAAADAGCDGLMVLPPYVYRGDDRETENHLEAVLRETSLSCMIYNNPIAYGTDITPEQLRRLAVHQNLHAVKESSGDVRRITAIGSLLGDRLEIFVGLDDAVVEGIAAGAVGWVAGLVNALPEETVRLYDLAINGHSQRAQALYRWFLPLLRLDTVPKFVQLIKLAQAETGMGNERVRPPRLALEGEEREEAVAVIREALASRPRLAASAA